MIKAEFCLSDSEGNPIPVSKFLSPFLIFMDNHKHGRYILKDNVKEIILEVICSETDSGTDITINEFDRNTKREKYTQLFQSVICDDIANRIQYEIIEPIAIGEPIISMIAEKLKDYK